MPLDRQTSMMRLYSVGQLVMIRNALTEMAGKLTGAGLTVEYIGGPTIERNSLIVECAYDIKAMEKII